MGIKWNNVPLFLWNEVKKIKNVILDPRSDLGDSERWVNFLEIINQKDPELAIQLQGIRGQGTIFAYTNKGKLKLQPIIDWNGWVNEKEYSKYKEKYLRPNIELIKEALEELGSIPAETLPEGIKEKASPWPDVTGERVYVAQDQGGRDAMHDLYPWAWIFNKGEVPEIMSDPDPRALLRHRGLTGSFWSNEKRKEAWRNDNKQGCQVDQGVPADAPEQDPTLTQRLQW